MKASHDPSERLLGWARRAPEEPLPETPGPGFATRVLARVRRPPHVPWWEYLALRTALAGCALAVAASLLRPAPPAASEPARLAVLIVDNALQH